MQVRLGFSIATAIEPDVLLLDEVLAVGDATFRSKCIKRIGTILSKTAVIFVSHDAWSVRRICDSVVWLKHGSIAYQGDTASGMERYAESTEPDTSAAVFLNTAPCITHVSHSATAHRIRRSDGSEAINIDVFISFDSSCSVNHGFCLGNIITVDEIVVGQFDFRQRVSSIAAGRNIIQFRVVDVQLARGKYSVTVVLYDETNKELLFNLRHFIEIAFRGNVRYGAHYAIATEALPDLSN